ncbi:brefeldin A-inhibited guanine nucleotide-exchange protein 3-like isoform X2 [Ornithodoros turicata]|uniref:brefeldin A-inhibited guanine nucleotide-exchange protein 3-like isoform X2 n=1 Tax=Ornithodoros turicata TaxID=34597 RepID=UPI00313944B5
MEDILNKILKESSTNKQPALRQACQDAQEILASQHALIRNPPYEVRQKCFDALQLALESKEKKLVSLSLCGIQQLLKEKLFNPNFESENEELWLPNQLTRSIASIVSQHEDVQLEGLKLILQCTCSNGWYLSQNGVQGILLLCIGIYGATTSVPVRTAALATAGQTVQSYVSFIMEASEDAEEGTEDGQQHYSEDAVGQLSPYDEVVPVLAFICEKLKEDNRSTSDSISPLLLQCIKTSFSCFRGDVKKSSGFLDFVWQQLCPRLVACLGSPRKDKNIVSAQRFEKGEMGRGSGCLAAAPSCHGEEAKLVYSIALELVRVVGEVGTLRPVLGSLFHRMLLYPPPQHCLEALKFVKEMLKSSEQLLQFAGPPLWDDVKNSRISDLDLLKIVVDALGECCHSNDAAVCYVSVACVSLLLMTLEKLVSGDGIPDKMAERINSLYPSLESADYVEAFRGQANSPKETALMSHAKVEHAVNGCCRSDCHATSRECTEQIHTQSSNNGTGREDGIDNDGTAQIKDVTESVEDSELVDKPGDRANLEIKGSDERDAQVVAECERDSLDVEREDFNDAASDASFDASSESSDAPEIDMLDKDAGIGYPSGPDMENIQPLLTETNQCERDRLERLFESHNEFAEQERKMAREFTVRLSQFLPNLLQVRSCIEADQEMQQFSSDYADALWQQQHPSVLARSFPQHITIVNADGIYLATYYGLLFNLKLIRSGYYNNPTTSVLPLKESQFIEEVHGSGVLVYVSSSWLSELYRQVMVHNFLSDAGYELDTKCNSALINLLSDLGPTTETLEGAPVSDVDGLGSTRQGAQQLSDYRRLERATTHLEMTSVMAAGMKFSRRVLTACWDTMLEVLSVLLNGTNSCGVSSSLGFLLGTDSAKEEHRRARDAVADSLDGLQRAAKLCNTLGLQSRCGAIFALLAGASCPLSSTPSMIQSRTALSKKARIKKSVLPGRSKSLRLHTSHVLSMEVLLSRGLELGSHSSSCWQHVFRCCCYVLELEWNYFQGKSAAACTHLQTQTSSHGQGGKQQSISHPDSLVLPPVPGSYGEEEPGPVMMPGSPILQTINVADMVKNLSTTATGSCILNAKQLKPIVEALSQLVDRLFDEAAGKLNLCALVGFLSELCAASRVQLFSKGYGQSLCVQYPLLLLNRLGEVMLRCARGGRPLIHVMKAWSIVAPHFVEVACHKDPDIAKRAVGSIHDIVGALLSAHTELPHFHLNEALFKPFENILCLELCDVDVQEQIVSCICEFVEGSTAEIHSGWRPLFGALRAVRMPEPNVALRNSSPESERERTHHLRVVLDVFDAFLGTDNPHVFANAAVDCLLCLLKHVRGPAELEGLCTENSLLADSDDIPLDMCQAALKYLEKSAGILSSLYLMPACPIFHSALRIKYKSEPNCVDDSVSGMELIIFKDPESASRASTDGDQANESDKEWYIQDLLDNSMPPTSDFTMVSLDELDRPTGVLHVWFLLLEGLAGAVSTCPRKYQSITTDTLFQLFKSLRSVPGPEFGVYAVNHVLLPMMQGWLRRTSKLDQGWDDFAPMFKQCCGLATELVVDYIVELSASGVLQDTRGATFMVYQLVLVLTECVAQPAESISRLGCACIRHLLVCGGPSMDSNLWRVASGCLRRASMITLHALQQLMVSFHADSHNFYGDVGQVKVAVRKDCTLQEAERLRQLSQQVFLLDVQRVTSATKKAEVASGIEDDRSYIFLLHPPEAATSDTDGCTIRVPFRTLVVSLLSHQILLQTLATVLLEGTRFKLPTLAIVLSFGDTAPKDSSEFRLAGQLKAIPEPQLRSILECLDESFAAASEFDKRPGLKFLVQKVAKAQVAANLFKQAAVSWAIHAIVLLELCLRAETLADLSIKRVNVLAACNGLPDPDHAPVKSPQDTAKRNSTSPGADDVETGAHVKGHSEDCQAELSALSEGSSSCKHATGVVSHTVAHSDEKVPLNPYRRLKCLFEDLCSHYVQLAASEDNAVPCGTSIVDEVGDQPIFFLIAQPDILPEILPPKKDQMRSDSVASGPPASEGGVLCGRTDSSDSSDEEDEAADEGDKVYSVVTQRAIDSMVSEYKKRKTQHVMPPPTASLSGHHDPKTRRKKSSSASLREGPPGSPPLPKEVESQRRNSIMKDAEAHIQVWSQLTRAVLELHLSLPESEFLSMVPVFYSGVETLIAGHCSDMDLRLITADWFRRVALALGFSGSGGTAAEARHLSA